MGWYCAPAFSGSYQWNKKQKGSRNLSSCTQELVYLRAPAGILLDPSSPQEQQLWATADLLASAVLRTEMAPEAVTVLSAGLQSVMNALKQNRGAYTKREERKSDWFCLAFK